MNNKPISQYLSILNHRTVFVLVISVLSTYLCYRYNFNFNLDLTLISIAIIFPLVFTIRGSFRRREKALEHLSEFRSTLKTLRYFLLSNDEMPADGKDEFLNVLSEISGALMKHLGDNASTTKELDATVDKIYQFIIDKNALISKGLREKIFRYLKDLHESIENLNAIHAHRTPISLKAYCKVFIYIFPVIYTPSIINNIGPETHQSVAYFIVILTEFILISLYNIQNQLEYPFDDKGLDDIKLDIFRMDR
tara:strand:+ start:234 stop:986 length:753 start_codon:yes stop_codon:yes gene_type:complete